MNAQDIRKAYLDFFAKRGHKIIPRANLVPQNDPSTLFTGSGMQPMVPYLLGETHPEGMRVADSQTVFRAQDIDEVGDYRHTTFFEMLGNWSLGDYFKHEQIDWIFEYAVKVVGLDPERLYITCYIGNEALGIPRDNEAAGQWAELFKAQGVEAGQVALGSEADAAQKGMQGGRIFFYDGKKNWWSRGGAEAETPMGDPCGPDSEMFYEFPDIQHDPKFGEHCHPNCDCGRYSEIGNNVFMAYRRTENGFEKLAKPNIDCGMGLERLATAANNDPDVFKISLMRPIVEKLESLSDKTYEANTSAMRVIADHLRAATFLAVDGVVPSNKTQGYVVRRLIRRATLKAFNLGIEQNFLEQIVPTVAELYEKDYPEVETSKAHVIEVLVREEKAFRQTLKNGVRELNRLYYRFEGEKQQGRSHKIGGELFFLLFDTYGFPVELSLEEAFKLGMDVDDKWREQFDGLMAEQRERSQTATKGQFKGGLEGHSDMHIKYHTATHLMYKALKLVLGDHVVQRGSNITEERLRFDFSHDAKMTLDEIKKVEDIVNEQIKNDLTVKFEELPTKEALAAGASGAFGDKYGEKVRVYTMGKPDEKPYSMEICGGPHVEHTGVLSEGGKHFKILKEEASSAGVRRIKAVLL
ncbi:MAG TPA: alanine--tRNA ligase [Candidatus Acidoferrum sp.]|nr:alanine--tRNA ligase [Candidatus Acidoferrum sp.]